MERLQGRLPPRPPAAAQGRGFCLKPYHGGAPVSDQNQRSPITTRCEQCKQPYAPPAWLFGTNDVQCPHCKAAGRSPCYAAEPMTDAEAHPVDPTKPVALPIPHAEFWYASQPIAYVTPCDVVLIQERFLEPHNFTEPRATVVEISVRGQAEYIPCSLSLSLAETQRRLGLPSLPKETK